MTFPSRIPAQVNIWLPVILGDIRNITEYKKNTRRDR